MLADHVHRHACQEQDRGVRVAKIVKPDHWRRAVAERLPGAGDVAGEPPGDVFGVAVAATVAGEHQSVIAGFCDGKESSRGFAALSCWRPR